MKKSMFAVCLSLTALVISGCSVVSERVRSEAEPAVPFPSLLREADVYQGKTVILGGYVLNIRTSKEETTIVVLQAPLDFRDKPRSKIFSKGRFAVQHEGFLEPPQHWQGIGITAAGRVAGLAERAYPECPKPCLKVIAREIHFLPEYLYTDYRYSTEGYVPDSWGYGVSGGAGPLRSPWYDPGGGGGAGLHRDLGW